MIGAVVSMRGRMPRAATKLLAFADIATLVLAMVVTFWGYRGDPRVICACAIASLGAWLWMIFMNRKPGKFALRAFVVPWLSAGLVVVVTFPLVSTVLELRVFELAALWTLGLVIGRFAARTLSVPIRVLYLGDAGLRKELMAGSTMLITDGQGHLGNPVDFDFVVLDEQAQQDPSNRQLVLAARLAGVPVVHTADLVEQITGKVDLGDPEVGKPTGLGPSQKPYLITKRWLDVALIVLFSPLLLAVVGIVAIAVLVSIGRPVFFCQQRIGRNGAAFTIFKFRTMRLAPKGVEATFATGDSGRITRMGRFLRRFRLDEIPQFLNVLRGDMSIIGPRPEQVAFARQFETAIPHYARRHDVRPGITGWAQVRHGYADDVNKTAEKLRYDLFYVKNMSLSLDARIVARTIVTLLTGFGHR